MKQHHVVFLPSGSTCLAEDGSDILAAARLADEPIETICGGKMTCGKCRVNVREGYFDDYGFMSASTHLTPMTEAEKQYGDEHAFCPDDRLACQAKIQGDVVIFVPEESRVGRFIPLKNIRAKNVKINAAVKRYFIDLPLSIEKGGERCDILTSELESRFGLKNLSIDKYVYEIFRKTFKESSRKATLTVWDDREIINFESGRHKEAYGLAVDVGTTSIACYLCDLNSGKILATKSALNPQIKYGEDVITRIAYAQDHPGGQKDMETAVISCINRLTDDATRQNGVSSRDVSEAVLVGNTVMHHIFLGLDILPLGRVPFKPAVKHPVNIKARDIGLNILPSANTHVLPVEAGYVGADNVGVLIAEEPYKQDETSLVIDIGTNGEIALGNRHRILSASCATGPAFEGANIKFGMRAAPGAIDRLRIDKQTLDVRFTVIGHSQWHTDLSPKDVKARGICGSGIIDAAAEMLQTGIIKKNGSFDKTLNTSRLRINTGGKAEFVIARAEETAIGKEITITQEDIRALQLAKAALYSGAKILIKKLKIDKPDRIILAGAFGTIIDIKRARAIGMFPDCGQDKILAVGNAAGEGACMALLSREKRKEAEQIARDVEYIELTSEPDFQKVFIDATHFPQIKGKFLY